MYDRQGQGQTAKQCVEYDKTETVTAGWVGNSFAGLPASEIMKPSSAPPVSRGEIASALDAQQHMTHELLAVVNALTLKLQPAIAPSPVNDKAGSETIGYGSPIAACVHENTQRVRNAARLLGDLLRDLAV